MINESINHYFNSIGFTHVGMHDEWVNAETGEFIAFDRGQWHWGMICSAVQDWPSCHYKRLKHLIKGC